MVYPLGARAGAKQQDIGSNNAALTFDGLASTPPFNGATVPDGGDRTSPASSSSSIDLTGMAQQEQRYLLVPSQEFGNYRRPTRIRHAGDDCIGYVLMFAWCTAGSFVLLHK
ncbi:hypothetical protein BDN71DRAFT_1426005 [Pleurotus eryngii]|uniref:Uncharacterized protein n=1 Tax=Pleurotus eryngii TaxID=5323 RepID=A0A9P6A9C1_PLEER|nr:hypothetical protein BDN71DRAFT_1426005 [Pleurotus eryngii]